MEFEQKFEKTIAILIFSFGMFVNTVGTIFAFVVGNSSFWLSLSSMIFNAISFYFFFKNKKYGYYSNISLVATGTFFLPGIFYLSETPYISMLFDFIVPVLYAIAYKRKRNIIFPVVSLVMLFFLIMYRTEFKIALIFGVVYIFELFIISFFTNIIYSQFSEIEKKNNELSEIAKKDPLTGVYNRYGVSQKMPDTKAFAIMLDIDNFKSINDTYGHDEGDKILKNLASILLMYADTKFLVSRYGGEEFLVYSLYDYEKTKKILKSLYNNIRFLLTTKDNKSVTVSGGMSCLSTIFSVDDNCAIKEADENLYFSKKNGKNGLSYNMQKII